MATIVKHKDGGHYIVVGFGYGLFRSSKPDFFFGSASSDDRQGDAAYLAVADYKGGIGMMRLEDCMVIEVDGKKPGDIIK